MAFSVGKGLFVAVALLGLSEICRRDAHARANDLIGLIGGASIDDATAQINAMIGTNLREFLDKLEKQSKELLDRGANAGSLLEMQAANSMTNLIYTIRSQTSVELDRQV